jgi:hypothetical protein
MAFLLDSVKDAALAVLTSNLDQMDICSQEPTTYTEATSTYSLGNKTSASTGSATDGDVDGRKVVIAAISDGTVTGTDDATHWAGTNGSDTLYAANSLGSSQAVTSGNTWTLPATDITIRDPS